MHGYRRSCICIGNYLTKSKNDNVVTFPSNQTLTYEKEDCKGFVLVFFTNQPDLFEFDYHILSSQLLKSVNKGAKYNTDGFKSRKCQLNTLQNHRSCHLKAAGMNCPFCFGLFGGFFKEKVRL